MADKKEVRLRSGQKSSRKRHEQSLVRRERNRKLRAEVRTMVRSVRELAAAGDAEKAATQLKSAARRLDQVAAKGVIHGNKVARLKSRLSRRVKLAKVQPAAAK